MTARAKSTTGHVRSQLVAALEKAVAGKLDQVDGRLIVSMANQISKSMHAEAFVAQVKAKLGRKVDEFGKTEVD
jgi:hypothetical protein